MPRTFVTLSSSLLVLLLTACGGGGSSDEPATPAAAGGANSLLVVANSVTLRSPTVPAAATAASGVEFADHTAATLGLPVTTYDATMLEVEPSAQLPGLAVGEKTAVIVALGDNGVPAQYAQLLGQLQPRTRLVCVSTWWVNAVRDAAIKNACDAAGGTYVFVGDLYPMYEARGGALGAVVRTQLRSAISARLDAALK